MFINVILAPLLKYFEWFSVNDFFVISVSVINGAI